MVIPTLTLLPTAEPFLSGSSGTYVESMYESWQQDRSSVHKVRHCQLQRCTMYKPTPC